MRRCITVSIVLGPQEAATVERLRRRAAARDGLASRSRTIRHLINVAVAALKQGFDAGGGLVPPSVDGAGPEEGGA